MDYEVIPFTLLPGARLQDHLRANGSFDAISPPNPLASQDYAVDS